MTSEKPCKSPDCSRNRFANQNLCFTHWRTREKLKQEERKKKKLERKISTKKYQKSELKKWHRKTWVLMSEYIRRKYADWRGMVECWTCRKLFHWKEMDCAHRHHGKLDLDVRNLRPCCVKCNRYLHGNLGEYERRLIEENGLEWSKQLVHDAHTQPPYTLDDLKKIHQDLSEKLKSL